jgi:NADP-dependent alcohol dehydrogenase
MIFGSDGLAAWLEGRSERSLTVLVDNHVAETEIVDRVRAQIVRAGRHSDVIGLNGPGDLPAISELASRLMGADLVVGIGGGSLLDQAKLAIMLKTDPAGLARLTVPQRSGLILLPPATDRVPPLVAVPTTLGTGAELSAVACLQYPQGKRLVMGSVLQPAVAVLDPIATATLPDELVAEGILEVLFRVVGLYVGDHRDLPTEDAFTETLAGRVMQLGNELRDARAAGKRSDSQLRTEVAKLSGLSHAGWVVLGRAPYASKGWYIANELSSALGLRKMTAVAALLPPLWRAITENDSRLGSARRLARMWERLCATDPGQLPKDPATGIAALIDSWRVARRITADPNQLAAIAGRTVRAWGAGLPMLDGLNMADIQSLLALTVSDPMPDAFSSPD